MSKKESKLKENDYVRVINTLQDYVEITKIKELYDFDGFFIDYRGYEYSTDEIIKNSSNIVDLLEKGDLLKFYYSKQYQEVIAVNENEIDLTDFIFFDLQKSKERFAKEIEWVITHEQLNEAKYEVIK